VKRGERDDQWQKMCGIGELKCRGCDRVVWWCREGDDRQCLDEKSSDERMPKLMKQRKVCVV